MQEKRSNWIDVGKCICMFAIFLGHYFNNDGTYAAGYLGIFVWRWHVPCMFFLSGCTQNFVYGDIEKRVKKNFYGIILPYLIFGAIALVFAIFYGDYSFQYMAKLTIDYLLGTRRGTAFVTQIWFLTALFVMKTMFDFIACLCKSRYKITGISVVLWLLGDRLIYTGYESLPYNIDLALHYIIFFILGYALFPLINDVFIPTSITRKVIKIGMILVSSMYAMTTYYGIIPAVVEDNSGNIVRKIIWVMSTLILILFICGLSNVLSSINVLRKLGKESLYLCGNEGIVNYLFSAIFEMFHIELVYSNPLEVLSMVTIRILFISYIIYPKEVVWISYATQKIKNIRALVGKNVNDDRISCS